MLSGKRGFSGTYKIANDEYRIAEAKKYEKTEIKRFKISIATALIGALSLPLLMSTMLNFRPKPNTLLRTLQKKVRLFDSVDGLFLNKYSLLWMYMTNYNTSLLMASRDKNEFRETLIEQVFTDIFYFFGDDIISGIVAKKLQTRYKNQLKSIALWHPSKIGIPLPLAFENVFKLNPRTVEQQFANKLSRIAFWSGIGGTALLMGIGVTLGNLVYTKNRIKRELAVQKIKPSS